MEFLFTVFKDDHNRDGKIISSTTYSTRININNMNMVLTPKIEYIDYKQNRVIKEENSKFINSFFKEKIEINMEEIKKVRYGIGIMTNPVELILNIGIVLLCLGIFVRYLLINSALSIIPIIVGAILALLRVNSYFYKTIQIEVNENDKNNFNKISFPIAHVFKNISKENEIQMKTLALELEKRGFFWQNKNESKNHNSSK